jgi:hypothetical protein
MLRNMNLCSQVSGADDVLLVNTTEQFTAEMSILLSSCT